jgi:hypothetical protein
MAHDDGSVVGGGVDALSVSPAERASDSSAVRNASGNSRPRFCARRRIPAAALGLKKYLAGTSASSTSGNDEEAPPPLGHSEEPAVQNSVGQVPKPEVGQAPEDGSEIPSPTGTE